MTDRQNAQEHEKVCALCLTVGGGHNDPTCPAKPSDTQNDTSELTSFMERLGWEYKANKGGTYYWQKFNGIYKSQMGISEAEQFYNVCAQREQAAELRGRESETEYWRQSGFLPLFDADKRLMELEKQATNSEKGDRNDTD